MNEGAMLDGIYEAAAIPDRWPRLLHDIAQAHGARGATVFAAQAGTTEWMTSPAIEHLFEDYVEQGWMVDNVRGAGMIAQANPWFSTDIDFFSEEEMRTMPVYRDFLIPLGFDAAAGTVIQGAQHDMIVITVEGFASHRHARAAMPSLNRFRAHLARAASLMARIRLSRAQAMVDGIDAVGTAAAVITGTGKLRSVNASFAKKMGDLVIERPDRLRIFDPHADKILAEMLGALHGPVPSARSTIVRRGEKPPYVIHLIPLRSLARDIFEADGLLLLVTDGANSAFSDVSLLRLLFDLTPTEARIVQALGKGLRLSDIASRNGVTYSTAKVHLRSIFAKTGVTRQAELVSLLWNWTSPPLPHMR
ncbi:LuxR family transcriptional regulator [Novosphingobium sp. Rr 2-17]|uniref:helix-turn-helix transcriptional regulator n=1 Tax=Novosphingobium sp. Rr 2-17 TaxID=555793 RepID=UPI000269A25B|nr:helix-turn-helix transcriptional regulator [Novosphingobium sp. Rr 2-17]EIZ77314.1 LuxR family transcriptional regulator [Novosphingobium sp. Rr 2-17]